ncbi:MAG: hypothetical protein M3527_00910 [Actinomycetota bacterium]|nr:hypothetical protein [Acidimicrobiia bacterium]MDQ3293002.1 hypothetical protein [Actinomycetota bacterium]
MAPRYDLSLSEVDNEGWISATVTHVDDAGDTDGEPRVDVTLADGEAGHLVAWSCLACGTIEEGSSQTVYASLPEMLQPVEGIDLRDARYGLTASLVVAETIVAQSDSARLVQRVEHGWCEA